jgi:hypothetical protein
MLLLSIRTLVLIQFATLYRYLDLSCMFLYVMQTAIMLEAKTNRCENDLEVTGERVLED